MNFKVPSFAAVLAAGLIVLAGCSTTDSRIKNNQAAFDAAPPDVQAKIQAGKVAVGFTPAQVIMAVGKPDRRYTRTTARGTSDIWAYESHAPTFSFGVGVASGGGGSAVGTGVGVTTGNDRNDDKLRVIFEGGVVVAMETGGK
jgi:hypothetical protein